jgi:AraC-like DNA-binding protein
MKPTFEPLTASVNHSFLVRQFEEKYFSAPYHFHPEYELTWIVKGCGKRYVGTHMHDYFTGDLVLLGSNLPHCWKTENTKSGENSNSIVIQFHPDFMGSDFFSKPEMKHIRRLLNNSQSGLQFTGNTSSLKEKMYVMLDEPQSFKKWILLMDILHELASTGEYVMLSQEVPAPELSPLEKARMNICIAYIVENFRNKISLQEVASLVNMTPHAFCRYFKKLNRKTFIEAVTDYRVDFAVRQLIHTDNSISSIGLNSGFNDISNFHKTFKARMKLSPLSYRNTFIKKLI